MKMWTLFAVLAVVSLALSFYSGPGFFSFETEGTVLWPLLFATAALTFYLLALRDVNKRREQKLRDEKEALIDVFAEGEK